jgi:hypothetical protein
VTGDRGADGLEAELDALHSAPLGEFTARRDALAKRLRDSGAADESRRVKALRKPTAVAWAINRLHLESNGLAEIEEASAALRASLRDPRSAEDRRSAIESRRRALERATASVVALLEGAGSSVSPALLRRIERTLLALATGASAGGADAPVAGRLHQELEPPGFEAILDAPAPAVAAARPSSPAKTPAAAQSPPKRPPASRPAKSTAVPARATSKPAPTPPAAPLRVVRGTVPDSKEIRAARAALDRAEGELERATDRVEAARMKVTDAEKALAAARKQVDAERRELAAARSRRDEARRELDRVQRL